jgi:hypothetical protein
MLLYSRGSKGTVMDDIAFEGIGLFQLSNVAGGAGAQPSLWARRNTALGPTEKQRLQRLLEMRREQLGALKFRR